MPKRKSWSKVVEEHGIEVRLFDRGGTLYRSIVIDGRKDRKSLGHSNRDLAETHAKALCTELAKHRLDGTEPGGASFGQVRRTYLLKRGPILGASRLHFMTRTLELLGQSLEPGGRPFRLDDFGQDHVDRYVAQRTAGEVRSADPHSSEKGVRAGTIRNELAALSTVINWAITQKVSGRRLLTHNPLRGLRLPVEDNPKRPRAGADRYRKLVAVADDIVPSGQLRLMLAIAHHTGRRINAICHLRVSDLLLTTTDVRAALAAGGMDEEYADAWTYAIRWRSEFDKQRYESITPIPAALKSELDLYLVTSPTRIGETWLFPYHKRPTESTPKAIADWWLGKAERAAELPHLERGGWHAFRRQWATNRKHLPVQDVMAAGGWRDVKALQRAYQGVDAKTINEVVNVSEATA